MRDRATACCVAVAIEARATTRLEIKSALTVQAGSARSGQVSPEATTLATKAL